MNKHNWIAQNLIELTKLVSKLKEKKLKIRSYLKEMTQYPNKEKIFDIRF